MIVVVGLSHHTAPIGVREAIALPSEAVPSLLSELCATPDVGEALIVSTCNRVELVAAGRAVDADLSRVAEACVEALCARAPKIRDHLYRHTAGTAVRHLFRVAASLDSLVLGEPQILGQLKQAYDLARELRTLGPILNRTLPRALRVAKRVRSETSIGQGQVSVPSVAVDLGRQIFGEFAGRFVMLVGSARWPRPPPSSSAAPAPGWWWWAATWSAPERSRPPSTVRGDLGPSSERRWRKPTW